MYCSTLFLSYIGEIRYMTLVKDMYDSLALKTGYPAYTNDTDCPDINRFLLEMISEGLQGTIDNLYISNNVLERMTL